MMTRLLLLLGVVFCLPIQAARAELAAKDYAAMVESAISSYVRPAAEAFSVTAAEQAAAVTVLCDMPSEAGLAQVRQAFIDSAIAWAALEYLDIGPWREADRGPRIYFFPDRKGVTGRHVRRALQSADPTLLTEEGLAQASVALQGLPALEYLSFGKGFEVLRDGGDDGYRCALAAAVAANLATLAEELVRAWAPDAPFVQALVHPTADGVIARTPKEAATLLLGRVPAGLLSLEERKLRPPLGSDLSRARPLRANYALSGITNQALAANLEGLVGLLRASGALELALERDADLAAGLDAAQQQASAHLAGLAMPLGEAAADAEAREQALAFLDSVAALRVLAGERALEVLGLRTYVNVDDGD